MCIWMVEQEHQGRLRVMSALEQGVMAVTHHVEVVEVVEVQETDQMLVRRMVVAVVALVQG